MAKEVCTLTLMPEVRPIFDHLHLILDEAHPGALNMAIDEALLETASVPVLRIYHWDHPTLSLGYSQVAETVNDLPVVRRWTGGGTVHHGDDDSTYALIVPQSSEWARTRPLDSYRQIHQTLADCLNQFCCGPCRLATEADQKDGALCFEAPALFDVLRGASKIAGAGQRRSRLGVLHQGSLSLALTTEFWSCFAQKLAGELCTSRQLSPELMKRAEELKTQRYGTESWLRRMPDAASASE